ncbi:efflux RND transporter periplasmic adaptor subunit [Massilia solisilvae]|uniref:Efflux RND transporter periplasmic adaptor subunit n=1 Tax=Massilia solisilvae TaxID=1811225 RepID=A0ABT2BJU9_9BURK|nr:efflux RND transporter periplasmic adaptor subunit [Massilia solisilvae]MCS0608774.1 efflux RND transporter periplasmic adaptor subunit [Massilia solisilvae]
MLRKTILVLAMGAALAACSKGPAQPAQAANGKDAKPVQLLVSQEDLLTVQSNSLVSGPVITGSIQPERRADLRAEVQAVVLQVLKENGEPVKKGDVLVKLDETSIRDSLLSAQEAVRASSQAFDQASRQVERLKTLRASGMVSQQAFDDAEVRRNNAQSDLSAARAREVSARQQLGRTVVRAPFDGIVSDRKVSNGDTASIGKELLKVIDPSSMRFEGRVSADKISQVKVGQQVAFRINGYGDQPFAGTVKRIDPAANDVTRQVEVLVSFAGQSAQPRVSGLYAEGRIDAETTDALMLPESALVRAGDKTYAWRLNGKSIAKVDVLLGARDQRTGKLEIKGGLKSGDAVLRNPGSSLKDGQPVELAVAKVASAGNPVQGK